MRCRVRDGTVPTATPPTHQLRVLKLTKSLPDLRAIISALMDAMGSVGYVTLLIALFTFIMACLGMVIMGDNDPYHFGTLTKAMNTVWRVMMLTSWEEVMNVNFYGCERMPNAYPFTTRGNKCKNPHALGFYSALYHVFLVGAWEGYQAKGWGWE